MQESFPHLTRKNHKIPNNRGAFYFAEIKIAGMREKEANKESIMIAVCGIDCSVCDIHLAPSNPDIAEKMVKIFVDMGYKDAKPDWFHCEGCSGDRNNHWSSNCEMMLCCFDKKHLENCSQCDEFMCEKIEKFANDGFKHHQEGVERLKKMVADRGAK